MTLLTKHQSVRRGCTAHFTEEQFRLLSNLMQDRLFLADTYLFWEGDHAEHLFYVKSGHVILSKSTDDGKEFTMHNYEAGDLIGTANPFEVSRYNYSARVFKDAEIGIINPRELEPLLLQYSDLSLAFMKWMGFHHRLLQTRLRDLMLFGKTGALSSTLIRLSNSYGESRGEHVYIRNKVTHSEISNMIGATRESVNRMLRELRLNGAIDYESGHIIIKDIEQLRAQCQCEYCPIQLCRV